MTTFTEGKHDGEFLLMKEEFDYSVETVTVASGAGKLEAGTVLGKLTSGGKYVAYDNTASDGSEAAAGVLWGNVDATDADAKAVVVVRGPAEIITSRLTWASANNSGAKTAGLADLLALGIVAR